MSPQFNPIRHVLKLVFFHFAGGASGSSYISNTIIIVGLLLSIFKAKRSMVPIAMGVVKTWLKK
jgi:hypothetical protein